MSGDSDFDFSCIDSRMPSERCVLVVGDVMLDRYLWGNSERVSPEAPVPVISVHNESLSLGGAGNVVANVEALGGRSTFVTVIGSGGSSDILRALIEDGRVTEPWITTESTRSITEKTRIIAARQQVIRFDVETRDPITPTSENALMKAVEDRLGDCGVLLLSDYNKGVVTPTLSAGLIKLCRDASVPVLVDPKGRDYSKYRGASLLTPNRKEASEASGIDVIDSDSLMAAGFKLLIECQLSGLLITLGEEGMALFQDGQCFRIPTRAREVFDVTGAGDTVVAALGCAIAAGLPVLDACKFANLAAGVVVGKVGTATATLDEIRQFASAATPQQSLTRKTGVCATLLSRIAGLRSSGKRVVFTNGCFDVLHAGHIRYLEEASRLGDILVVGLNGDDSVTRLKGKGRPINILEDRALLMSALEFVDFVIPFDEDTPLELIKKVSPDVLVKGEDYLPDTIVGADVVRTAGGTVRTIPLLKGRSTTSTLERIRVGASVSA